MVSSSRTSNSFPRTLSSSSRRRFLTAAPFGIGPRFFGFLRTKYSVKSDCWALWTARWKSSYASVKKMSPSRTRAPRRTSSSASNKKHVAGGAMYSVIGLPTDRNTYSSSPSNSSTPKSFPSLSQSVCSRSRLARSSPNGTSAVIVWKAGIFGFAVFGSRARLRTCCCTRTCVISTSGVVALEPLVVLRIAEL